MLDESEPRNSKKKVMLNVKFLEILCCDSKKSLSLMNLWGDYAHLLKNERNQSRMIRGKR